MSVTIERYVSPFIAQQFPAFYREQGPNFVAFVKAYYEWLEQSGQTIGQARSMLDNLDIDTTNAAFIEHFRRQYIDSLPESIVTDKQLLIKHVLDLYRSKGTPRAVELLFRMIFNEDIEIYVPGNFIFKPSDNVWRVPRYIEVTSNPDLPSIVGTQIQNIGNTAAAIVESVSSKIVNGRTINIVEITELRGEFKRGDRIYQSTGGAITAEEAPVITGSLTAVALTQAGLDFSAGDILDIVGSGIGGKARVSAIDNNFIGAVDFAIASGGSGFTTNAEVVVKTTLNLNVVDLQGFINAGDVVVDSESSANGTVVFSNNSLVKLVDFGTANNFRVGTSIVGPTGNAVISRALGGTGSGATFRVGSITNKESITFNNSIIGDYLTLSLDSASNTFLVTVNSVSGTFNPNDTVTSTANVAYLEGFYVSANQISNGESLSNSSLGISGLYVYRSDVSLVFCTGSDSNLNNANLISGAVLVGNATGAAFQLISSPALATVNGTAIVESANSTSIRLGTVNGYFIPTKQLTSANSGASATIVDVVRQTDWDFSMSLVALDNLDTRIEDSLPLVTLEIGTIASLSQVNRGTGYLTDPYVTVTQPDIAILGIYDENLTIKGNNAIITSTITGGNGMISTVEIIDSGYGYMENESVTLVNPSNQNQATGTSIVYRPGRSEGRWLNRRSFSSDVMYIQDGRFYQNYSYMIISQKMMSTYETLVRDLVHPAGLALFGAYRSGGYIVSDQDVVSESSIIQQ